MAPRSRSAAVPVPRPVLQAVGKAVLYLGAAAAGWTGNHWLGTFERLSRIEEKVDRQNENVDRRIRELKQSIDQQSERVDQVLILESRRR